MESDTTPPRPRWAEWDVVYEAPGGDLVMWTPADCCRRAEREGRRVCLCGAHIGPAEAVTP